MYTIFVNLCQFSTKELSNNMWSFDLSSKSWFSEKSMPYARSEFGFVVAHLQIYVIGGLDDKHNHLKSVICYDHVNVKWTEMRPMDVARSGAAVVKHNGHIWVAGGRTQQDIVLDSIERYDPIIDRWTTMDVSLRIPRCYANLCSIEDRLYIVGGLDQYNTRKRVQRSVDRYDSSLSEWIHEEDMEETRCTE